MAGGKKRVDHVAWQIEVTTNEEWEDLIKLQGLIVVDVYSEWCGPCQAMASHLKEIKLQLGDDLLHCALAKSDAINQLAKFRSRSEPTWLFLAGGEPVALVRGANAPLIRKTLLAELEAEKQVLANARQRVTLAWEKIEFPGSDPAEDDVGEEETESSDVPDNWAELDALFLTGTQFRSILEPLLRQVTSERSLEVAAKTYTTLNESVGECVVIWLAQSDQMLVHDEHPAGNNLPVEWLAEAIQKLTIELVQPENEVQQPAEAEVGHPSGAEGPSEEAPSDPAEVPAEPTSLESSGDQPESTTTTECQRQLVEFRLYDDPAEKEALVQMLKAAAEASAAPESPSTGEAPAEDHQQKAEDEAGTVTEPTGEPVINHEDEAKDQPDGVVAG